MSVNEDGLSKCPRNRGDSVMAADLVASLGDGAILENHSIMDTLGDDI